MTVLVSQASALTGINACFQHGMNCYGSICWQSISVQLAALRGHHFPRPDLSAIAVQAFPFKYKPSSTNTGAGPSPRMSRIIPELKINYSLFPPYISDSACIAPSYP
jgi:hypothetical protein